MNPAGLLDKQQIIIDKEYYKQNSQTHNLAVLQAYQLGKPQIDFPVKLDIPRFNWGIVRRLVVPFIGDEYFGLRICVNMWIWRESVPDNLANGFDIGCPVRGESGIGCPIREIRLWQNGILVYSCTDFRIDGDGLSGQGIVHLGSGKLAMVLFSPILPPPLIDRLADNRYDDYILDVEFNNQDEYLRQNTEKITLKSATVQLLTRCYSTDIRREKIFGTQNIRLEPVNNGI